MKKYFTVFLMMFLAVPLFGQLSGTYYIGATAGTRPGGGDPEYSSFGTAVAALNSNGVSGPVTMYFLDATYTEAANVTLGCTGTSATNTITFKPYTGVTTAINFTDGTTSQSIDGHFVIGSPTASSANLVSTTYLTIDGSNANGGTTKDLTINGPVTSSQRSVVRIFGDNDNITFKNCIIINNCSSASTNAAINVTNYFSTPNNFNPDNLTVQNCTLTSTSGTASTGFHVANSGSPTVGMTGLTVSGNIIAGDLRGIFVSYTYDGNISDNMITVAATGATTNITSYGITVQTNFATSGVFNIYNNKLTSLTTNCQTSGASNGIIGIDNQNTSAHVVNIYNNFIGGFGLTGTPNNARIYGIRVTSTSTSNIYHNTIYIPELTDMTTSNNIAGIAMASAAASEASPSASANVTIKNNIIKIDETSMKVWGIRRVGSNGTFTSDYNDVFINATNTSGNYGFFNASDQQTLGNWQTGSSQDANSKNVDVTFNSSSDLHLSGGSNGDVNLIGTTGLGISTDIDGDTRSGTFPYMGADEASSALPVELASFTGISKGSSVELSWKTATEVNNTGFDVERRNVTDNSWQKIGFVNGSGTSNSSKVYGYTDAVPQNGSYSYRLKQIDRDGHFTYSSQIEVTVNAVVKSYDLSQNFPNPFNPTTTIRFSVPVTEQTTVKVFDIAGREIETLFNGLAQQGEQYNLQFNARNLSSGIYFYVLQTETHRDVKKMQLLK